MTELEPRAFYRSRCGSLWPTSTASFLAGRESRLIAARAKVARGESEGGPGGSLHLRWAARHFDARGRLFVCFCRLESVYCTQRCSHSANSPAASYATRRVFWPLLIVLFLGRVLQVHAGPAWQALRSGPHPGGARCAPCVSLASLKSVFVSVCSVSPNRRRLQS